VNPHGRQAVAIIGSAICGVKILRGSGYELAYAAAGHAPEGDDEVPDVCELAAPGRGVARMGDLRREGELTQSV
jgi:hypothetical protein